MIPIKKKYTLWIMYWIIASFTLYPQSMQGQVSLPRTNNYTITVTPLDETDHIGFYNGEILINAGIRTQVTIEYFDGLGRPVQTIEKGITPNHQDLVSMQTYDASGRDSAHWLPVPNVGNGALVPQSTIKSAAINFHADQKPFSYAVYETSPLNRPIEQYGAGQAWHNNKKSVKTAYLINNESVHLACALFEVTGTPENPRLTKTNYYSNGQLFVTETKDEDGNTSYEFKDKLGQIVLTRQINQGANHDTYYVYDKLGNLTFVLPPLASDTLSGNREWSESDGELKRYAYLYRYDYRNRCIAKRIPGAGWQYFVYDGADQLILSQDGEQRLKGEWAFNKYDALGRVIITGIHTNPLSHGTLRSQYMNIVVREKPGGGDYGYTWGTPPMVTPDKVLLVNYYDNYEHLLSQEKTFRDSLSYKEKAGYGKWYMNSTCSNCSANGLLVGTRVKMLDGSGELVTALYYDDKGQVVQKKSTNHLGGFDKEYTAYTFTGLATKKLVEHSTSSIPFLTELYEYEYDHASRPTSSFHTLNNEPRVLLSQLSYDELGQVKTKNTGGTENTTYEYNIRGWQTSQTGNRYSQKQYYNSNPFAGGKSYYNGNISAMVYKSDTQVEKGYSYQYDGLNRLISGVYGEGPTLSGNAGRFNEQLGYDKHGNITSLQRYGVNGQTLPPGPWYLVGNLVNTYGLIDDLHPSFHGNQLTNVSDAAGNILVSGIMEFKDREVPGFNDYGYDANGRRIWDLNKNISGIKYNLLNLPQEIQHYNGHKILYSYSASGEKLHTEHLTATNVTAPIVGFCELLPANISQRMVTDYVGNKIYENGALKMIRTPEGYIAYERNPFRIIDPVGPIGPIIGFGGGEISQTSTQSTNTTPAYQWNYYFNLRDHLGSNRVVIKKNVYSSSMTETFNYYPYGMLLADNNLSNSILPTYVVTPAADRFKYNNKELDRMHGMDWYDYGSRVYDGMSWMVPDPLAEKYYSISPYVYCGNNPIINIDPNGEDYWSTSDPELIRQFINAYARGANLHDFSKWYHMDDDQFAKRFSFNDETGIGYLSYAEEENGESVVSFRTFNANFTPASFDGLGYPGAFVYEYGGSDFWRNAYFYSYINIPFSGYIGPINPGQYYDGKTTWAVDPSGRITEPINTHIVTGMAPMAGRGGKIGSGGKASSKGMPHGDGGRSLSKVQKQITELKKELQTATGRDKVKIQTKIDNITRNAQKNSKGETHWRK